jgi:pyruvate dehydrogenase E2 component (dihydrolipoamide acetyltransferase)
MAIEFKFPDVGEGITEGEIVKWRVKEGDAVKEGDTLAEVETDKAIVEIPAPAAGKILKLSAKEGERVKVGQVMCVIGAEGEEAPAPQPAVAQPAARAAPMAAAKAPVLAPPAAAKKPALATPATRALAKELGVDIEALTGSGEGGRVTDEDVRAAAAKPAAKVALKYDFYGHLERVALKGMRRTIAKHMVEAKQHAPHATGMDDADVTHLWEIREREKAVAEKKGVHLTFLPFIIKAVVAALKEHPLLNASVDEEREEIVLKKYYNISMAVDTEDGLMAPVIKHCDDKAILDIAREIERLAAAARSRKIDLADLKGGTFSITNFGSVSGTYAVPIINYPEVAILGVGRIEERPVVRSGSIVARRILPLSLTFDHRVVDGAEGARFLSKAKAYLEDPDRFLVE